MGLLEFLRNAILFLVMEIPHITVTMVMGLAAIYLLLPRAAVSVLWGAGAAAAAVVLAGVLLLWNRVALAETPLFYAFSALAVLGGGLLITQRNPVHAALSFALVVLSTCGLFLLQAAPFLMAATIIVYAGAIIVTFLFVIMLAQQAGRSDADQRSREPLLSAVAGFVLLGTLLYVLERNYNVRPLDSLVGRAAAAAVQDSATDIAAVLGNEDRFFENFRRAADNARGAPDRDLLATDVLKARAEWEGWKKTGNVAAMKQALDDLRAKGEQVRDSYGFMTPQGNVPKSMSTFSVPPATMAAGENVASLGRSLFTDFLIPVELGGTLLLVATIGAIAIATRRTEAAR